MKPILCVVLLTAMSGCAPPGMPEAMTREQMIAATKQCEQAEMQAVLIYNWEGRIADVECHPKEQTK